MYRIVENDDGSTGVYSSQTGALVCSVNSKKNHVGIGHPIRSDSPAVSSPRTLQMGLAHSKLNTGQKCSHPLESTNSLKIQVSPIMNDYPDDDSSLGDFPPLPSDDQDSTIGDFSDDCVTQQEFLHCLGIVSSQKLEQSSSEDIRKEFPQRIISKIPENLRGAQLHVKILEDIDICSPLGIRVLQSSPHHELDESGLVACVNKSERYCQLSSSSVYCGNVPQLRNRELLIKYPVTYRPLKGWRDSTFVYSFNKRQRLEHLKSLKTGLNKRGRRLKRLCREFSVKLTRLSADEIKSWVKRKPNPSTPICASRHYQNFNSTNNTRPMILAGSSFKSTNASLKHSVSLFVMNNIHHLNSRNHTAKLSNSFGGLPGCSLLKSGVPGIKSPPVKLFLQNGKPRLNAPTKIQPNYTSDNSVDNNDDIQILFIKGPTEKSQQPSMGLRNSKKGSSVMNCSVPLQDVSKQIDKVGGKCFVKGTAIKACGIQGDNKGSRKNGILLSNNFMNSNCVTSNLLDHAYHRNPLVNSTRQTSGVPSRNSVSISVKNVAINIPHQDRENIRKIDIPRVVPPLLSTKRYKSLMKRVDPPRLPPFKYPRTSGPSVLAHNGMHVKPLKTSPVSVQGKVPQRTYSAAQRPVAKQIKKNIQVIDITDDGPCENLTPVKNKTNGAANALKWMFRCYGCGYRSMFFSKLDFDDAIAGHMTQYHSVNEPDSFLNSFVNTDESAIVTEAFPGYKNNRSAQ